MGNEKAVRRRIERLRKNRQLSYFERWEAIGEDVSKHLQQNGRLLKTSAGLFLFDNSMQRAFPLHPATRPSDTGLASLILSRYGINGAKHGFKHVLNRLNADAFLNVQVSQIRRLAYFDRPRGVLFVSRFDGHLYRLDGERVTLVPNGSEGQFFADDPRWEPYSYSPTGAPQFDRILIESANFSNNGALSIVEQRLLWKLWTVAPFFPTLHPTKPPALFIGPKGGGKSLSQRKYIKFLYGSMVDLQSIECSKADGFASAVTSAPVVAFDNVDERIPWLPDMLARIATGTEFPRRVLYTTNDSATYRAECFLTLSARTAKFIEGRDDLPDRMLIFRTERRDCFVSESALLTEVAELRSALWSEFLDELNAILGHLRKSHEEPAVKFRMADFASFALRVGEAWGCRNAVETIFRKLEREQANIVFEDDPLFDALVEWAHKPENEGRLVDCTTLNRELDTGIYWPYQSARSLGQSLSHLLPNIEQFLEVTVQRDRHNDRNLYGFHPLAGIAGMKSTKVLSELESSEVLSK